MRSILVAMTFALTLPALASAHAVKSWRSPAASAGDLMAEALRASWHSSPECRQAVSRDLAQRLDALDALTRHARPAKARALRDGLKALRQDALDARCPRALDRSLRKADRLLATVAKRLPREEPRPPMPPPPPSARMGAVTPTFGVRQAGHRNVRLAVSRVSLMNMPGRHFYLSLKVRAENGRWGEASSSPTWTVPNANFTRNAPYAFMVRYGQLRRMSSAAGRFVARVALLDGQNHELASQEIPFSLELNARRPPPRRCGPGVDPGCDVAREGHWAMDGRTFKGLMASLRSEMGDLPRENTAKSVLRANWVTAKQLGRVLDLFKSELVKLQVGKMAARRTVDPSHAFVLSAKFHNTILGREFTQAMAAQH